MIRRIVCIVACALCVCPTFGCTDPVPPASCESTGGPCPEICSAEPADEDQDGRIDEGLEGQCCAVEGDTETREASEEGVCELQRLCWSDHRWSEWRPLEPPPETCNGRDDDCDGKTDEDFDLDAPCVTYNASGTCSAQGVRRCGDDGQVLCEADFGQFEGRPDGSCDGVDDDCDGVYDEDPPCNGCPSDRFGPLGVPDDVVCIPAGSFSMGAGTEEVERLWADSDELPRHRVVIHEPFLMGQEEVSIAEWRAIMDGNPARRGGCIDDCPVERVSYFDALRFANLLSERAGLAPCYRMEACDGDPTGGCEHGEGGCLGDFRCDVIEVDPSCVGFRLPTEAEWEYAARAGGSEVRWTEDLQLGYMAAPELCGGASTRYTFDGDENPFGLINMLGNVSELTHDVHEDGYEVGPSGQRPPEMRDASQGPLSMTPRVGLDLISEDGGSLRAVRGGNWLSSNYTDCRSAWRAGVEPAVRGQWLGLRLVRRLPPAARP